MHELSLANNLVEIAIEHAQTHGVEKVCGITLRVGALACVHKEALEFSFELVAKETMAEGATLSFIDVPVAIYCGSCARGSRFGGDSVFSLSGLWDAQR